MGHNGSVLVDTNVIIESLRVGVFKALAGGYRIETVEDCVAEIHAGNDRKSQRIEIDELRSRLSATHSVGDREKVNVRLQVEGIQIDNGELALWAHAKLRKDNWIFCGPDRASIKFGMRLGFGDRIVSLEKLLKDIGCNVKGLRRHYSTKWLIETRTQIRLLD